MKSVRRKINDVIFFFTVKLQSADADFVVFSVKKLRKVVSCVLLCERTVRIHAKISWKMP